MSQSDETPLADHKSWQATTTLIDSRTNQELAKLPVTGVMGCWTLIVCDDVPNLRLNHG